MSLEDVDKTRHLIHGEFANFIKKKGGQKNPRNDVEFPSYGNHTILKVKFLSKNFKNSISTKPKHFHEFFMTQSDQIANACVVS